jgi:hypothetical protein
VIIPMSADFSGYNRRHDILVIDLHLHREMHFLKSSEKLISSKCVTVFLERATEVQMPIRV